MQHETQVDLIRRLGELIDAGTKCMPGPERINPVSDYLDQAQFHRERDVLFRGYPMVVGFAEDVATPGSFITNEDTGVPVLVLRNQQGELRAFINACRHRGAMVADRPCGQVQRTLVCPYHAWSYDLDGKLVGLPDGFGFDGIDRAAHGLVPLPVEQRHGLIWVLPQPAGKLDVAAHLGALDVDFQGYGLDGLRHFRTVQLPVPMNWKLLYDTFLEIYHFTSTHRETLGPLFMRNLALYDPLGQHARFVTTRPSFEAMRQGDERDWNLLPHCIVSNILFPNVVLNYVVDHAVLFRVFPVAGAVDRSVVYISMFTDAGADGRAARHWETNFNLTVATVHEDLAIGQRIQRTLASGANSHFTFGRYEPLLGWWHDAVRAALAE